MSKSYNNLENELNNSAEGFVASLDALLCQALIDGLDTIFAKIATLGIDQEHLELALKAALENHFAQKVVFIDRLEKMVDEVESNA